MFSTSARLGENSPYLPAHRALCGTKLSDSSPQAPDLQRNVDGAESIVVRVDMPQWRPP